MSIGLFQLVRNHLSAQLDMQGGLSEVVLSGLPDELTAEQLQECTAILAALLTLAQRFITRSASSMGSNRQRQAV